MNQRVFNLSKWSLLEEGAMLEYKNPRRRTVIVDVNCPAECAFYVMQSKRDVEDNPEKVKDRRFGRRTLAEGAADPNPSEMTFLGLAKGRDRFEFAVDGAFALTVEGSSAYVYTADSQDIATRIVDPVIFTRLANRKVKNPDLQRIENAMRINQLQFQAALAADHERLMAAMNRRLEIAEARNLGEAPPDVGTETVVEGVGGRRSDERSEPVGEGKPDAKKAKGSGSGSKSGKGSAAPEPDEREISEDAG